MRSVLLLACGLVACSSNESGYVAKRVSTGTGGTADADGMIGVSGATGCTRDLDCRAPRVCEMGVCVDPASSGGASGAAGAGGRSVDASAGGAAASGTGGIPTAGGSGGRANDASSGRDGASRDGSAGDAGNFCSLAMFIMQDRSGSMVTGSPPPASPESWNNSAAAITAFVQDPNTSGIDIGLGTFPVGPNDTASCNDGADCGTPVVPIASLPGNAQAMIQAMQQQTPSSPIALTPTECGLRGMINQCLQFMAASTSGEKCVAVLVTDGTPTQCDTNLANLVKIVTAGHENGVTTFTLGLPGADLTFLNSLAAAGGTDTAIDVSGGPQTFAAALNSVRTRGASDCPSSCEKTCNGVCVANGPANGCSSPACSPCAVSVPANGFATCTAGQCDVACLPGFQKSAGACSPVIPPEGGVSSCNGVTCASCALAAACCLSPPSGACGCMVPVLGCQ